MLLWTAIQVTIDHSTLKGTEVEPTIIDFDHTFAREVFYRLSDIINLKDEEKDYSPYGREFGRAGEQLASDSVIHWLGEAGLESENIKTYLIGKNEWNETIRWKGTKWFLNLKGPLKDGYNSRYDGKLNMAPRGTEWSLNLTATHPTYGTSYLNFTGIYTKNNVKYTDSYPLLDQSTKSKANNYSGNTFTLSNIRVFDYYHPLYPDKQIVILTVDHEENYKWMTTTIKAWTLSGISKIGAFILADDTEDFFNDTIFMACSNNILKKYGGISINGTSGKWITDKLQSGYTITADMHLNWTYKAVKSTTVVGEIEGKENNTIIVISSHLDGHWNQASFDEAVGTSTMLGIIKYLTENNITPKYTIHFCFWTGHEWGDRGLKQYILNEWLSENGKTMKHAISLGNYGHDAIPFGYQNGEFQINCYNQWLQDEMRKLAAYYNYTERTADILGDANKIPIYQGNGYMGGECCYCFYATGLTKYPIKFDRFPYPGYHRDGIDHHVGDVNTSINEKLLEVENEIIAKTILFLIVNPDCWTDTITFTPYDTNEDNKTDTVNVSFTLNSSAPDDKIRVVIKLAPQDYNYPGRSNPISSSTMITDDVEVFVDDIPTTLTISDAYQHTSNTPISPIIQPSSSAIYNTNTNNKYIMRNNGENNPEEKEKEFQHNHIIIKDYYYQGTPISDAFNITIKPFQPPGLYELQVFIYNSTGYIQGIANETHIYQINMTPINNVPTFNDTNPPEINDINYNEEILTLTVNTVDPDNDPLDFTARITTQNTTYYPHNITIQTQNNNSYTLLIPIDLDPDENNLQIQLCTQDQQFTPGIYSNWSPPVNITLDPACWIQQNTSEMTKTLPNETLTLNSSHFKLTPTGYSWCFNDGTENTTTQNTTHSYNQTSTYYVNLAMTQNATPYNSQITIQVQNTIANFTSDTTNIPLNTSISFNDISRTTCTLINWTWDFDDSNISYQQTPSHLFTQEGIYHVNLTVTDNQNNSDTLMKTIIVDNTKPIPITTPNPPLVNGINMPVIIYADVYDNLSGIQQVTVNITSPNGTSSNNTMTMNLSTIYDYEYHYQNTTQTGEYFYQIWVTDQVGNRNHSFYRSFLVLNTLGYTRSTDIAQDINNRITGILITPPCNGTVDYITACLNITTVPCKTQCMLYTTSGTLIGTTEEKAHISTGNKSKWFFYNTSGSITLQKDSSYILSIWSNATCDLAMINTTGNTGWYKTETYDGSPSNGVFTTEQRTYQLMCSYATRPQILNISRDKDTLGFGETLTVNTNISETHSGIGLVTIDLIYPDNTSYNITMLPMNTSDTWYQYQFNDTWQIGQYNYTIWACDRHFRGITSSQYSFNVTAYANISVCTVKNIFTDNEWINLTDPPAQPVNTLDAWQLINRGETWNQYYNQQEKTYRIICSDTPINYKDASDNYQPINTTIQPLIKEINNTLYTRGVTRGIYSLYLKQTMNATDTTPAVIIEKDRYRMTQTPPDSLMISYNQRQKISTICMQNTSQITQEGNTALYEHAYRRYNTTDEYAQVSYQYYPTMMKSNLILTDQTAVQDRYNLLHRVLPTDNLWVQYQTQMTSIDTIGNISLGVMQNDIIYRLYGENTTVDLWTADRIWFTDQNNTPVFGIPPLYAVDDAGNATLLMKHLHCEENTDMMTLTIYVSLPWLADDNRTYPVYIDPSVEINAGTGDGWAKQDDSANWDTVHDGSGNGYSSSSLYDYGIGAGCGMTGKYSIHRSFFRFNTSSIPDDANIVNASVFLYGKFYNSQPIPIPTPQASGMVFQKWTGGGTISNGDYNNFSGGIYGSLRSWTTGIYNELVWENALSDIDVDGYTDICVREWAHDYNDSAPEEESSYSNYLAYAEAPYNKPYINITYELPPTSPEVTLIIPEDYAVNISLNPCVKVSVTQQEGKDVTVQWYQNATAGSWTLFASNVTDGNETVMQNCPWINENGKWYHLKIDAKVGSWPSVQEYYQFYPGVQSKIENTGDTDINGFLVVWLEEYNVTSGNWSYLDELYRDDMMRRVNSSCSFGIDTVCNGLVNGSMLAGETGGVFRVYAGFYSLHDEVLVCSDDTELVAWWEFEIE